MVVGWLWSLVWISRSPSALWVYRHQTWTKWGSIPGTWWYTFPSGLATRIMHAFNFAIHFNIIHAPWSNKKLLEMVRPDCKAYVEQLTIRLTEMLTSDGLTDNIITWTGIAVQSCQKFPTLDIKERQNKTKQNRLTAMLKSVTPPPPTHTKLCWWGYNDSFPFLRCKTMLYRIYGILRCVICGNKKSYELYLHNATKVVQYSYNTQTKIL